MADKAALFDVIATTIPHGERRVMAERMTLAEAEKFIKIAVARRGVDKEFFTAVLAGSVRNDDYAKRGM